MSKQNPLFLASQSPRRAELLSQLGLEFEIIFSPIEETALPKESPESYVLRMGVEKAIAGYNKLPGKDIWVLGSDTAVVIDGKVLGKPKNKYDAKRMLGLLSGKIHQVLSSVAVIQDGAVHSALSKTWVTFEPMTTEDIDGYWQTGEPEGKAGGYAIQGLAAQFISKIEGSYSGVMGLPLCELRQILKESRFYGTERQR